MKLSVKEAATIMGCRPRTLRSQLARGDLPGVKRAGHWTIELRHLPLTEAQRASLDDKADDVRMTVESALRTRKARLSGTRSRSVADLDAFRLGAEVLRALRDADSEQLTEATRQQAHDSLEKSLLALTEVSLHFDRRTKREALGRCRSQLAQALGLLLLADSTEAVSEWIRQLEDGMVPAVVGLARWIDRLRENRR